MTPWAPWGLREPLPGEEARALRFAPGMHCEAHARPSLRPSVRAGARK